MLTNRIGLLPVAGGMVFLVCVAAGPALRAQEPDGKEAQGRLPALVRFTEAREHPVRRSIQLPGTVEARTRSMIATEIQGLVTRLEVREGDRVRKGQALLKLRTTPLRLQLQAAAAQLKEAESRRMLAERSLARAEELFESEAFSQQQLDESLYEFNAWQGRVENLQAQIARIEFDLEHSTIRAPFDGVVVARFTEVGEWRDVGEQVFEVLSLDDLEIHVDVPERYFGSLRPGGTATVAFEALPGLRLEARVRAIIPRAAPQARTFPLKLRLPRGDWPIGVGMLTRVSLPVGEPVLATVVPKDAVVPQGAGKFVFLLNGDEGVSLVPVKTGAGVGSWVVVEGDVRAGQKVVTRGNERLQPGQPVKAEPLEYPAP